MTKEKARQWGELLPNADVCQDNLEYVTATREYQVSRITRRCAISAAMAAIIAPLVFGEVR
ncbi:hypothetical protein FNL56_16355 [Tardiphaga sp. vice304]|uniref:hypothetical protein n=1 Tax=Tardiphaga sp. vice304 TaxID=2592817 RepID=UPI001163C595|nr:hypothetical protein [Tardiphaga sp. vice304]QDM27518.1 hypothetical protein FNL56_16355 [Tardiphaga sp. vice304]